MDRQASRKKRVVIAGLGDTGLLTAMELAKHCEVVGISPKPCLVSGQELGLRLSAPARWKKNYLVDFDRYVRLDHVQRVQGQLWRIDAADKSVEIETVQGERQRLSYDALVIASGVTNGFWREASLQDRASIDANIEADHLKLAQAKRICVVGGGVSGVAVAGNIAATWPDKAVSLYFSAELPLPGYHRQTRRKVEQKLAALGVHLYPKHRAVLPPDAKLQEMSAGPVHWSTGQAATPTDLVLWTVGKVRPNSDFVPEEMKTESGFIKVDAKLQVPGHPAVFAVGDVADTDPLRCSARNWGHRVVAHNVLAALAGDPEKMKSFEPSPHRWGSIFGLQANGLEVYSATGRCFRVPRWLVSSLLLPLFVDKMIYGGVRKPS